MQRRTPISLTLVVLAVLATLPAMPGRAAAQATDLTQLRIPELNIENKTFQEALVQILEGSGLSVNIPSLQSTQDSLRTFRLLLRNTNVDAALRAVLGPLGLTFSMDNDILNIYPDIVASTIRFNYLAARFATPLQSGGAAGGAGGGGGAAGGAAGGAGGGGAAQQTGLAGLNTFKTDLRAMLSGENAVLFIDLDNHIIHVEDYRANVDRLARYIDAIDVPMRQIKIEARLVEVIHTGDTSFGVGGGVALTGSPNLAGATADLPVSGTEGDFIADLSQYHLGGLYGGNLDLNAALRALSEVSDAQLLSKPTTVVMDGKLANISLTDQIPYSENIFGTGSVVTTTQFKDVGIQMNVIPTILDSTTVQLQVSVQFSTAPTRTASGVPTVSQRSASSPVMVHDGQFFVMAGLVREEETTTQTGIPILRSLPLLKYIFGTTSKRKERRELILFVQPTIINPFAPASVPPPVPPAPQEEG